MYGRAYDGEGNPLQPVATSIRSRHVVWTGQSYLVIDPAERNPRRGFPFPVPMITTRLLHRGGTPAGPDLGYLVGQSGAELLSMAWNGTHVAVLAVVEHRRLLLFDAEGRLAGDTPVEADVVAVAPNGNSFFFLRGTQPRVIAGDHGRYAVVGPSSIPIVDASGAEIDNVPIAGARTIVWDGSAWHTAYRDAEGRICTATFTRSTDVRRDCRVIADAANPAVGVIPRRKFLAWEGANRQIVTDSGIASIAAVAQRAADTTLDATGLLVAWIENGIQLDGLRHDGTRRQRFFIPDTRANDMRLAEGLIVWRAFGDWLAMRLEANGAPLHPILPLGTGASARVVRNGDGWLVLRYDYANMVVTAISGEVVITGEHVVAAGDGTPEIAAAGDGFLVTTRSALQRIDRNGVPVGAAIELPEAYDRRIACSAQACLIAMQGLMILVDHEGRTLRGPQPLPLDGTLTDVTALADGAFRVYTTELIVVVGPDGTPRGATRWNSGHVVWGGVEIFNGRPIFFFSRDGRVYLRDLPPRSRAVRH